MTARRFIFVRKLGLCPRRHCLRTN